MRSVIAYHGSMIQRSRARVKARQASSTEVPGDERRRGLVRMIATPRISERAGGGEALAKSGQGGVTELGLGGELFCRAMDGRPMTDGAMAAY